LDQLPQTSRSLGPRTIRTVVADSNRTQSSAPASADGARGNEDPSRARRLASLGLAVMTAGLLAAACGSNGSATPTTGSGSVVAKTVPTTSSTTTTTPANVKPCGSNRDPFDPTLAPPPAGSPAIC